MDDDGHSGDNEGGALARAPEEGIVAIDDIVNPGKKLFEENRGKIEEALKSEQAEGVSDKLLDGAAEAIKKVVPPEHHAKVDETRANVDKHVGNE